MSLFIQQPSRAKLFVYSVSTEVSLTTTTSIKMIENPMHIGTTTDLKKTAATSGYFKTMGTSRLLLIATLILTAIPTTDNKDEDKKKISLSSNYNSPRSSNSEINV